MKSIKTLSLIFVASTLMPASAHAWSWSNLINPKTTLYIGTSLTYFCFLQSHECYREMVEAQIHSRNDSPHMPIEAREYQRKIMTEAIRNEQRYIYATHASLLLALSSAGYLGYQSLIKPTFNYLINKI